MFRSRMTAVLLVSVVAGALLVAPTGAGASGKQLVNVAGSSGALSDLVPASVNPTDGAGAAALVVSKTGHGSLVVLRLWGLDRAAAGVKLGAHVHSGPCVPGDGAASGPHYNSTGGAVVDNTTEVWLDFAIRPSGSAVSVALVPFVIESGARSIVVHEMPTMPSGAAGTRLACLPLDL